MTGTVGRYFVKVRAESLERLRDLQRVYDADVFGHTAKERPEGGFEIDGLLSEEELDRLTALGYRVEVVRMAE